MELETSGASASKRYQHFFLFEIVLMSLMLTNLVILAICKNFVPLCNVYDVVLAEASGVSIQKSIFGQEEITVYPLTQHDFRSSVSCFAYINTFHVW